MYENYTIVEKPEITLEANPDDLSESYLLELKTIGINRLSIGIQSFFEEDLKMMNRAHNSGEAKKCLEIATRYFDNISLDLIYGIPGMTNERWQQNIATALSFGIPHISSYALTVEPKTALNKLIQTGEIPSPNDEVAQEHFMILVETLEKNGFVHYELSNFGKENYFSQIETISTKEFNRNSTLFIKLEVCMDEVDCGKSLNLKNIFYDLNKFNINEQAKKELNRLVQFMQDNPNTKVEISSHTDSRDTNTYNQTLSQNRANAAVDYVISQGINGSRIIGVGYGETRLLNKCADGVECTETQHQLNRRTEMKVICPN
jgi:outer membrane protein OmpA-like peptidoglycan-associated protein